MNYDDRAIRRFITTSLLDAAMILSKGQRRAIVAVLHSSLVVVSSVILSNPTTANAQLLRCASHHLTTGDHDEALRRARRLVPKNNGTLTLISSCWNRDFARAWLRTKIMQDTDSVHWWWAVSCNRQTRAWSCDVTRERRIEVAITAATKPMTIISSMPDAMSASRARAIIAATWALAMSDEMPLPACSQSKDDALLWRSYRFSPRPPDLEYPAAEIYLADAGPSVDYGDLRINLDSNDRPICWDGLIVVT